MQFKLKDRRRYLVNRATPDYRWWYHYSHLRRRMGFHKAPELFDFLFSPELKAMVVYPEKNVLFMKVSRTGGTSIVNSLDDYFHGPKQYENRNRLHELMKWVNHLTWDQWNRMFKFSFVRHPATRVVSCYKHFIRYGYLDCSFEHFLRHIESYVATTPEVCAHFMPANYTTHMKGRCAVDYLGRYESLESDFRKLASELNAEDMMLKSATNAPTYRPDPANYDPQSYAKLLDIYQKDFEYYHYSSELDE